MLRASELGSAREDLAGQARGDTSAARSPAGNKGARGARSPFTRAAARSIQP